MKTPAQRREAALGRLSLTPEQRRIGERINREATRRDNEDAAARSINKE